MNYIVFDLENNCAFSINKITGKLEKGHANSICPNEVIEIGAVKLDENLEVIDTLRIYIKPKLYKQIHPKVKKKTKITISKLSNASPFKQAIKDFANWIKPEYILCCWGRDDILTLKRNCEYHKLNCDWISKYIDVQHMITEYLNHPHSIGLKDALGKFNISIEDQLHDALNDAAYTAKLIQASDCLK